MNISAQSLLQSRAPAALVILSGVSGLLFTLVYTNSYTLVIPPLLLFAGISHFVLSSKAPQPFSVSIPQRPLLIVYFITLAAAVNLYYFHDYSRSLGVHVLTLGLFLLAVVSSIDSSRSHIGVILIIFTSILHRSMVYYAGAVQMGMDALFHNRVAHLIAETGSLEVLDASKYWYAPFYHIYTGSGEIIMDTSTRNAALLLPSLSLILVPGILIYALSIRHFNTKVGALAVFLFLIADYSIAWSVMPVTTTIGAVHYALALFAIISYATSFSRRMMFIFVISATSITWSHQVSFFVLFVTSVGLFFSASLFKEKQTFKIANIPIFLFILLMFDWIVTKYSGPAGDSPAFLFSVILQLVRRTDHAGSREVVLPEFQNAVINGASALTPAHAAGIAIFIGLGAIGGLAWLQSERELGLFAPTLFGLIIGLLLAVSFAGPVVNIDLLIPRRWFVFIYMPLSVLASFGIYTIVSKIPITGRYPRIIFLMILILSPASFMSLNFMGSLDDPVLDAPEAQRFAMTEQENTAYESAIEIRGHRTIIGDFLVDQLISRHYGVPAEGYIYPPNGDAPINGNESLYVYRDYMQTDSSSYYIHHQGLRLRVFGPLQKPPGDTVYSNGKAELLVPNT